MSVTPELRGRVTAAVQSRSATPERDELRFLCPAHDDHHPSARWSPVNGVWRCDACGQGGGAIDLAGRLGVELNGKRRDPVAGTSKSEKRRMVAAEPRLEKDGQLLERFATARSLPRDVLHRFGVRGLTHGGRPALRFPTMLGIDRLKYLDGKKPKYGWVTKGGRPHWYGLAQAREVLAADTPLYLVNGEPSVWACSARGVAAVCLCAGEGTPPAVELVRELGAAPVRVVYDVDDPGRCGAHAAVAALRAGGVADAEALDLAAALANVPGGDVDDLHRQVGDRLAGALAVLPGLPQLDPESEEAPRAPAMFIYDDQLEDGPPRQELIGELLAVGDLALLVGDRGSGKTFIALDLAFAVATGLPWLGMDVRHGSVVYVVAEGHAGLRQRVCAWKRHHGRSGRLGVAFYTDGLDLLDAEAVGTFVAHAREERPLLVVVDTLNRCMPGGSDSDGRDVGRALEALEQVRRATSAAVLVLHHVGHEAKHRARGHSSLEAAVDTVLMLERDGDDALTLSDRKQRDAAGGHELGLALRVVDLGDGVSSCVVEAAAASTTTAKSKWVSDTAFKLLRVLVRGGESLHAEAWRELAAVGKSAFYPAKKELVAKGLVEPVDPTDKRSPFQATADGRSKVHGPDGPRPVQTDHPDRGSPGPVRSHPPEGGGPTDGPWTEDCPWPDDEGPTSIVDKITPSPPPAAAAGPEPARRRVDL